MLFTQLTFVIFLLVVLVLHWGVARSNTSRKLLLLGASYVFYGWWDVRFVALVVGATIANYTFGRILGHERAHPRAHRIAVVVAIAFNLGLLGVFKYFNFFTDSLVDLLNTAGFGVSSVTIRLTLPIAISFFTFEAISYVMDIRRGIEEPERSFLDFSLFIAFFPRLVAGPIVRPSRFLPQLKAPRRVVDVEWRSAVTRIVVGFVKKAVIADTIGLEVDRYWRDPAAFGWSATVLVVVLYSVQIYGDFSGYSDMAIGTAKLLGYQLDENFDRPYLSRDIADFWRRWHMTLSSWLRDYLYIPLGGSRGSRLRTYRNLLLTMVLGGLWHGAAWTFVVWGSYQGIGLAAHRYRHERWPVADPRDSAARRVIATATTFGFVSIGWVFFRAPDLSSAGRVLAKLVNPRGSLALDSIMWWYLTGAVAIHLATSSGFLRRWQQRASPTSIAAVLGITLGAAVLLVPSANPPFIYFQF